MPLEARLNDNVFALFKTCIASLVFHRQFFLDSNLHPTPALIVLVFYSETIPHSGNVTTKYPWNSTVDTPQFTGLPVDCIYMEKLERLRMEMEESKMTMISGHNRVIREVTTNFGEELDN